MRYELQSPLARQVECRVPGMAFSEPRQGYFRFSEQHMVGSSADRVAKAEHRNIVMYQTLPNDHQVY